MWKTTRDLRDQCEESTSIFGLNTNNLEELTLNPAMELCQPIVWIADHDTSLQCVCPKNNKDQQKAYHC